MNENEEINPYVIIRVIGHLNGMFPEIYNKVNSIMLRELKFSDEEIKNKEKEINEMMPSPYRYYLGGHCVSFSKIMCAIFGESVIKYASNSHVIVKIDEHFYDARGLIDDLVTEDYTIIKNEMDFAALCISMAPLKKDEMEFLIEQELIELGKEKLNELTNNRKMR